MSCPPWCWHFVAKSRIRSYFQMMCTLRWAVPPGRGIWWPRGVLHKVILTFLYFQMRCTLRQQCNWECIGYSVSSEFQIRCTLLVEASGGQEEYYIRSSWHSGECNWECMGYTVQISDEMYPPIVTSGNQEQHEVRSCWHWLCLWVMLTLSSGTEHYYTRWVWHVELFRCTEGRCTPPQLNLVLQSSTPCQFDM